MYRWIGSVLVLAAVGYGSFLYGKHVAYNPPIESVVVKQDTVYVNRPAPALKVDAPETVVVYQPVETVRVDSVYVPVDFNIKGVINEAPVQVKRGSVVLRSFNPLTQSYVDQTYKIPQRRWRYGVEVFIGTTTKYDVYANTFTGTYDLRSVKVGAAGLDAYIYYRRLGVGVRTNIGIGSGLNYEVSARYKFLGN